MESPNTTDREKVSINLVQDEYFVNTYHIQVWVDIIGNYTMINKGTGKRELESGGREKYHFTVNLSFSSSGKKIPIYIIFKGVVTPENPVWNKIYYKIKESIPYNTG